MRVCVLGYWASTQSTQIQELRQESGIRNQESASGFGPARSQFLVPVGTQGPAAKASSRSQRQTRRMTRRLAPTRRWCAARRVRGCRSLAGRDCQRDPAVGQQPPDARRGSESYSAVYYVPLSAGPQAPWPPAKQLENEPDPGRPAGAADRHWHSANEQLLNLNFNGSEPGPPQWQSPMLARSVPAACTLAAAIKLGSAWPCH